MFGVGKMDLILVFVIFPLYLTVYVLPTIIAFKRRHRNKTAITLINLLLGWSIIGWIVALLWSFTNDPAKT